jgi:hypothetical protein
VDAWRRVAIGFLVAAGLLTLPACSVPPEHVIIRDFFAASRLRDLTALSRFSTTVLEPRERGTVSTFEVEAVAVERTEHGSIVKDVIVAAVIRQPDGQTVEKRLIVTLRRPQNVVEERPLYDGWKVVEVK